MNLRHAQTQVDRMVATVCLLGMLSTASGVAVAETRTLAHSGQQAPGLPPGVRFDEFGIYSTFTGSNAPVLNDDGEAMFLGRLAGTGVTPATAHGLWSTVGGLHMIARSGDEAPGMPPDVQFLGASHDGELDSAGDAIFSAVLQGTGVDESNRSGIWIEESGQLQLLAGPGLEIPGTPFGTQLTGIREPRLNESGRHAFVASMSSLDPGLNGVAHIWTDRSGTLASALQTRTPAPGTPSGTAFGGFPPQDLAFNNQSRFAFHGFLSGPGVNSTNNAGIWAENASGLRLIAREGGAPPGVPGVARFGNSSIETPFLAPALNDHDRVAFLARATINDTPLPEGRPFGIWAETGGPLRLVALQYDPAPTSLGGGIFVALYPPVFNNLNDVVFRAELFVAGAEDAFREAVVRERGGQLELIARSGRQAPGTPAGVTFLELNERVLSNDLGQIVFFGQLAIGPDVTPATSQGIWAVDVNDEVRLVVRTGDVLEVLPGDFRTVENLALYGMNGGRILSANTGGTGSSLNDLGLISFWARFSDDSEGMFVSDAILIPEPGSLGLALLGILVAAGWRAACRAGPMTSRRHCD